MARTARNTPAPPQPETLELAHAAGLGPKSAAMLQAAGITRMEQLRQLGSVAAYAQVQQSGQKISLNLLWALEGALSGLHWQQVAREHRTSLLLALEEHTLRSTAQVRPVR